MNSIPPRFLNLNWDQAADSAPTLDSAFSSIVSAQASDSPAGAESLAFYKLIGGMHSGSEEASPQSMIGHLNPTMAGLPPLLGSQMPLTNLDQLAVDPGFAQRAAKFSSFDVGNYSQLVTEFGVQSGSVSRAGSSQSMKMNSVHGVLRSEMSNGVEESSVSDPIGGEICLAGAAGNNTKKRKALPGKNKGKSPNSTNSSADNAKVVAGEENSDSKRSRNENCSIKPKAEQNESDSGDRGQRKGKESNEKSVEPPKDYIHVRARRGQATDSHSLAERVRREKISQRMKLLQDLVPGCNKVTGKAVMLDEIINYVQSLQHQVEFLSMKLATVNPRLDFNNLASIFPKDVPNSIFPFETSGIASSYANQPHQQGTSLHSLMSNGIKAQNSLNLLDPTFHQNLNTHHAFQTTFENAQSQIAPYWDDDLHSFVHMDMGQNPELAVTSHSFNGSLPITHMKTEI